MIDRLAIILNHKRLAIIAVITVVALLLFGMLVPVYVDEVGWRLGSRAAMDGFDKLANDTCGAATLAVPPWFMMPVRFYSAWFNQLFPDPFYVRLSGVAYALALVMMIWRLVARVAGGDEERRTIQTICLALIGLGTLPLLLVWSRPEQPILLSLLGALLIGLKSPMVKSRPFRHDSQMAVALRCLAVLACAAIAMSYHMKGVAMVPAFGFCLILCGSGRQTVAVRAFAVALLIATAASAARYWIDRVACPGNLAMAAANAKLNVSALLLQEGHGKSIFGALQALSHNANYLLYLMWVAPDPHPMSHWLVPAVSQSQMVMWRMGLLLAWAYAGILAFIGIVQGLMAIISKRRFDPRPFLALLLMGLVMVWGMTQTVKNVYDCSFVLVLTIIAIALGLSSMRPGEKALRKLTIAARILGLALLLSGALLVATYLPSLTRAETQQAYLVDQPFSQSVFGYGKVRQRIVAAARLCGIDRSSHPRALLLDDVTYFAFMQTHRPQQDLGVVGPWSVGIDDPVRYLKSVGSDGAVLGCHHLPPPLRARARRVGEFCCLSAPNW